MREPTKMEDCVARLCNYPICTDEEWGYVKRLHHDVYLAWVQQARNHIRALYELAPDMWDEFAGDGLMWKERNSENVWKRYLDIASPPL